MDDILGHLPPELLNNVLSCLLPQHIKNLRLVSRKYHDASSHLLMKRAFFALRPATLAVFNKIIEHPIFSHTVIELVYDTSLFRDQRERLNGNPDHFSDCLPLLSRHSQEALDAADREYRSLFSAQESISNQSEDIKSLRRASRLLVNLESIVYTDWYILGNYHKAAITLANYHHYSPRSWYILRGPLSWDLQRARLPLIKDNCRQQRISPLLRTLYGFNGTGPTIRNLTFELGDTEGSLMDLLRQLVPSEGYNPWKQISANLHTVKVITPVSPDDLIHIRRLTGTLATAKELRSLTLSFNRVDGLPIKLREEGIITSPFHWPHIHTISLSGIWQTKPEHLLRFLRRHSATIKDLGLRGIYLTRRSKESWIDIALEMQTFLPDLNSLHLNNLSEMGEHQFAHLCGIMDDDDEEIVMQRVPHAVDCAFRRRHLRLLETWILTAQRLSNGERLILRQEVEDLRGPEGWLCFDMMETEGSDAGSEIAEQGDDPADI